MDKCYQIITELRPLMDVQNCVLLNIILKDIDFFCYKISGGGVCCMSAALLSHPVIVLRSHFKFMNPAMNMYLLFV